jgi:sugar lactone lactonase YvrE
VARIGSTRTTRLLEGLTFPEAPRWREDGLWFCDMLGHTVHHLDRAGELHTVARFDEAPGGIGFTPDGDLLVVGIHSAKVYVCGADPADERMDLYVDLAEAAAGDLDDMVVTPDGTLYVGAVGDIRSADLERDGRIVRVGPDRDVSVQARGLPFPNGIVVSDDGAQLYAALTFGEQVAVFDIGPGGGLSDPRPWVRTPGRHPDGLCAQPDGALWVGCFAEGEFVRFAVGPSGEPVETDVIDVGSRWATGVVVGGPGSDTLYMTVIDTDFDRYQNGIADGSVETRLL